MRSNARLFNRAEHFAAQLLLAAIAVGQHAARRGHAHHPPQRHSLERFCVPSCRHHLHAAANLVRDWVALQDPPLPDSGPVLVAAGKKAQVCSRVFRDLKAVRYGRQDEA